MIALKILAVLGVLLATGPLVRLGGEAGLLVPLALPGALVVIAIWRTLGPRAELVAWAVFLAALGTIYLDPAVASPHPVRETAVAATALILAGLALAVSPWFIAVGLTGHVLWDFVPRELTAGFTDLPLSCLVFDGTVAAYAGWQAYTDRWTPLRRRPRSEPST